MNGSFNGIPLRQIISVGTQADSTGFTRTTFRIRGKPNPKLEQVLQLNAPALMILGTGEIEGKIIGYSADVHYGYEITIESKKDRDLASELHNS